MPPDPNLTPNAFDPLGDDDPVHEQMRMRKPKQEHRKITGRFLRGPIPWAWLEQAGALPGRALFVGLVLWQMRGAFKRSTFRYCLNKSHHDGVPRRTAVRAIQALERAKLIRVVRKPGSGLEVTILDEEKEVD
jgi:predicted RNA-binding protein YlxR (DUF448 family)